MPLCRMTRQLKTLSRPPKKSWREGYKNIPFCAKKCYNGSMPKTMSVLESKLATNAGWVLVLLLVAGSSFLLGSSYKQKNSPVVSGTSSTTPTQPQSVIGDIANTLQSEPSVTQDAGASGTVAAKP